MLPVRVMLASTMKLELMPSAAFACGILLLSPAGAADRTGYLALTSDYVFRGVTYSDGHAAVQAGADIAFDSGVYAGIWGSTVDLSARVIQTRDLQANFYLGYSRDLSRAFSVDANVVAYTFPGTQGNTDYDFVEYSIAANFDDRAWLEYSYSPDIFHRGSHTHNVELFAEWQLPNRLVLGGGAGYYDVSSVSGTGYGYWQAGVSRRFGRFDVDLRYHDTNRFVPFISTYKQAQSRVVLGARLLF